MPQPKHHFAVKPATANSVVDDLEQLVLALDHLRCMSLVVEQQVDTILFPGVRSVLDDNYYYVGDADRDLVGFATFNVLERIDDALARSRAILDRYVKDGQG